MLLTNKKSSMQIQIMKIQTKLRHKILQENWPFHNGSFTTSGIIRQLNFPFYLHSKTLIHTPGTRVRERKKKCFININFYPDLNFTKHNSLADLHAVITSDLSYNNLCWLDISLSPTFSPDITCTLFYSLYWMHKFSWPHTI